MASKTVMTYSSNNIFARILRGELPCHKIFENEHCIAILDAFPLVRGHSLLLPKNPVVNVLDMPADVAANFLRELPRLAQAVQRATQADGVTIVSNSGSAAGQVVFHSHFHVIPRFDNDGLIQLGHQPPSAPTSTDEAKEILFLIQKQFDCKDLN